ncbi:sorting and assembly machinery component 50-like protein [Thalictrum thalictroides]|uniref:Sorting and assembly machinery component 50-like protein n=1 Tax=Thalictrum thalictroides TaxID=46969 RepID=A0A7J6WGK7_THATH|nr:sorting and assembly machinery component 50-like protein [Thalictrum thalictroides]
MNNFMEKLSKERVHLRVHDVIIKGNTKTKDSLIETEVETLKKATTVQELIQAATIVNARLNSLEIFDGINITIDSGPPELPGTSNVIIEVVEAKSPLIGNFGIYTKPQARSGSLEGSLKLRNLFGYGDIWDGSWAYGWDQASEISAGIHLPRFKRLSTPLSARISLLSQDWLNLSSYKESMLGLSLGLFSTRYHDLAYNFTWRTLTDPSQMASRSVREQLGHSLISSLRYRFKIDCRDSPLRPTQGYAFVSTTQLAGLMPDSRSLRFLRQEFDLRYAIPLGFCNAALNLGLSVGAIFPWGSGFLNRSSPISERFFIGGQSSAVCGFGGPTTLLGFKSRGLGPTELRRVNMDTSSDGSPATSTERDALGGDLALTAFADLSFNFPVKVLTNAGIHGHLFASTGNLTNLAQNEFRNFSVQRFGESFRTSVGAGAVIPTNLFRLEINYCHIIKQAEYDSGKSGFQFSFSSPL